MAGTPTRSRDNAGHAEGALRDTVINLNKLIADLESLRAGFVGDHVFLPTVFSIGSTDTRVATTAVNFTIAGIMATKAADAVGTAFGALGTIPADTWGIIAADVVAAGTVTYLSGALNYTTGYATEAAARAAEPPRVNGKARLGTITIKTKAATAFVVGTDALAGGASGNPASATGYYPAVGIAQAMGLQAYSVRIPTVLSRGSTDTNLQTTAFTFYVAGVPYAKAAVGAGTAFGALGTVPADKWGLIAVDVNAAGTLSYVSAAQNYNTGYATEDAAKKDNPALTTGKTRIGYITFKTAATLAFVVGTDALAGGSSGNPASVTTYYPAAPPTTVIATGFGASQIADATTGNVILV